MGYNLLINGVYWGYNPLTTHLLTSWDIQVLNQTPPHLHDATLSDRRLAMACDVVVQLDEHLCLTQDAPQLAAMFFRRPVTGIYV